MNLFDHVHDKSKPLSNVVSWRRTVPLERGLCYCFYLVEKHGFGVTILSAARDVTHIHEHNHQYGTHLHDQAQLILLHEKDPRHYAAANSVDTTSHCLHSDGNPVYRVPARGRLPWFMRGIDLLNNAQAQEFCSHAAALGLHFVRPYPTTGEGHHVICERNPTEVLVNHSVIHRRHRGLRPPDTEEPT